MIDPAEIAAMAIADFGQQLIINLGQQTITVDLVDNPTSVGGDMLEHHGPLGMITAADAIALEVQVGDTLSSATTDYAILSIDPDGMGGLLLALEVV